MTIINLSSTSLLVRLPSGNRAVYTVQPQHLNLQPLNQAAIEYGTQVAHAQGDLWFKPGGWEVITDQRLVTLLERCPDAEVQA